MSVTRDEGGTCAITSIVDHANTHEPAQLVEEVLQRLSSHGPGRLPGAGKSRQSEVCGPDPRAQVGSDIGQHSRPWAYEKAEKALADL